MSQIQSIQIQDGPKKFYIYQVYDQHGVEKTATPRQRKSFPVFEWDRQTAGHPEMSRLPFLVLIASRARFLHDVDGVADYEEDGPRWLLARD